MAAKRSPKATLPDGIPRVDGRTLGQRQGSADAVIQAMARYGCCVIDDAAGTCDAWPALLAAAGMVHASDAAVRYPAWRRLHATWRGYQPSKVAAENVARAVDVDPAFVSTAAGHSFSAFDVGSPWPVTSSSDCGAILGSAQPWPDLPEFAEEVTAAFAAAHRFGVDLARWLLTSEPLAPRATVPSFDAPCSMLRLLRYDETSMPREPHVDFELLTMVSCSGPGLQVMDSQGEWREPVLRERDMLLMAGDTLEAATFGVIRAAVHRVASRTAARHSAVVFVGVDYDLELLMPSTGKRMPFGQYLEGMLVRTTPHLWSSYQNGELTVPYPLPEPHPFKGSPRPVTTGDPSASDGDGFEYPRRPGRCGDHGPETEPRAL